MTQFLGYQLRCPPIKLRYSQQGIIIKPFNIYALAILIPLACSAAPTALTLSKDQYQSAKERIAAELISERAACKSLPGNASGVCSAEANRRNIVATAELEANYRPSQDGNYKASVATANADYLVAREKCQDKIGDAKPLCVKAARAVQIAAKLDAMSLEDHSLANRASNDRTAAARKARRDDGERAEANKDPASAKRNTEYQIAKEQCESSAGDARIACLKESKGRFGPL